MAEEKEKKPDAPKADQVVLDQLEALKKQNAELAARLNQIQTQRPPSKAELKEEREKREAAKRKAMEKQDKEAQDRITIVKYNRDGEMIRERECAKVDLAAFKKQGYKVPEEK